MRMEGQRPGGGRVSLERGQQLATGDIPEADIVFVCEVSGCQRATVG